MKKLITIIFSLLILFILVGCSYKELDDNEQIVIFENSVQSLIFNRTEHGYNNSTSFYVVTSNNENSYIKQGKIYNDKYTYYKLVENRDFKLVNAVNGQLFFEDENGLQSVILYDNETVDHSVSFVRNGFGEVIQYIGTPNFINNVTTKENQIKENVDNNCIKYVGLLTETIEENEVENVIKKDFIVSYFDNTLYIDKKTTTKSIDQNGQQTINENEIHQQINAVYDIKKAIVIDYSDTSKTILLLNNNEIVSIDNYNLSINIYNNHSNISYFESVNTHFYLIENNTIFVYDVNFNLVFEQKYPDLIIGSVWLKERSDDFIRVATISENKEITLHKIPIEIETN